MSINHSYLGLPKAPASANLPKKPGSSSVPLHNAKRQPSESLDAGKNMPMYAQGDAPAQCYDIQKVPLDMPGLSSTTKDILARVQNEKSNLAGERPRIGYLPDNTFMAGLSLPSISSASKGLTFSYSSISTSSDSTTVANLSLQNASPSVTSNRSGGGVITIREPYREVFDPHKKFMPSTATELTSQNLPNSKPGSLGITIQVAPGVNSQDSITPGPVSSKSTTPSSSRRQCQYVLSDGTITTGKGLGRGRPGIKRGPRKPKLDVAPSDPSKIGIATASTDPRKKRKRSLLADNEEHVKTSVSLSDDADSDDYTPKATHTRSGRHTQKPSTFVPTDSPVTKKPRPSAETSIARDRLIPLIKKRVYKGKEQNALCELCNRGRSTVDNAIVFCDGCNYSWHQECHDPRIPRAVVKDTTAQWFCKTCIVILGQAVKERDTAERQSVDSAAEALNMTAEGAAPTTEEPVPPNNTSLATTITTASTPLVGARSLTLEQRWKYLRSLSQEQLVDLLLRASRIAPDLPIFPTPAPPLPSQTALITSTNPAPITTATTTATTTASPSTTPNPPTPHSTTNTTKPPLPPPLLATSPNPNLNPSRAAKIAAPRYTSPSSPSSESADNSDSEEQDYNNNNNDNDDGEEEEDYRPSHTKCYPKPGQGLMVRLPPDKADEHILLEGVESRTFSHSMKGSGTGVFDTGSGKRVSGILGEEDKENWLRSG